MYFRFCGWHLRLPTVERAYGTWLIGPVLKVTQQGVARGGRRRDVHSCLVVWVAADEAVGCHGNSLVVVVTWRRLMLSSVDDELSSISGSDTSSSLSSSDDDDDVNSRLPSTHRSCLRSRQRLMLTNSAGQLLSIQQCVVNVLQVCAPCMNIVSN